MLDRIEDRLEIGQLRSRYCHYYDDGRIDDFVALFAPDALLELGPAGAPRGTDAIRTAILAAQEVSAGPDNFVRHFCDAGITDFIDADHARGRAHVLFQIGHDVNLTGAGTYADEYVRLWGDWRIAARRTTFVYFGEQPGGWPTTPDE